MVCRHATSCGLTRLDLPGARTARARRLDRRRSAVKELMFVRRRRMKAGDRVI